MISILNNEKKSSEMEQYEKETGKYAVWRGIITEGFKKWKRGEKIYDRDKERISLYIAEETKDKWHNFIKSSKYSSISKLIRDAVDFFINEKLRIGIDEKLKKPGPLKSITNLSHDLKEALTSIKGYSQLLLENYKDNLKEDVLSKIKEIFNKSIFLENKIKEVLEKGEIGKTQYDLLLIEDDPSTIKLLTTFFESKGYSSRGVISGSKGIEELKANLPKLILLDIILPDINGYDVCKIIKSDENLKDIPVFFLTAIPSSEVEKKIKHAGADGYILKPFDFSDFEILYTYL